MKSCPSADVRTLLFERLDALLQDCKKVMNNAQYGQVVNNLDDFLLLEGRDFIKEVFQKTLQEHIEHQEQRSELKQCPHCKKKRISKIRKTKTSRPPTDT